MRENFKFLLAITILSSCTMFDKDQETALTIKNGKNLVVKVYLIHMGATTNDALNVYSQKYHQDSILIGVYEHNLLKGAEFLSEDTIQLMLSDTGSTKIDTVKLNVNKVK